MSQSQSLAIGVLQPRLQLPPPANLAALYIAGSYPRPVRSPAEWDLTTFVREAAVAVLTLVPVAVANAAVPVESERVDPIDGKSPNSSFPRIVVYADEAAATKSQGGTAPAFTVTATIVLQALTQRALRQDAIADVDTMVAQIKDILLTSAEWVKLTQNVGTVRTQKQFNKDGAHIIGDGRVMIECSWVETHEPRLTQPLKTIAVSTAFSTKGT